MAGAIAARQGFLDISPGRRHDGNKENDIPVLSLIQFSKPPFVTFGTVKLGTSKSAVLRIENPTEDVEAEVTVEKIPSGKGFSINHNTFTIEPAGSFALTITWTPSEEGGIRELIVVNANGILKHQAVLLGRAEATKKKKKSLWDTIKKKNGENIKPSRAKKVDPPLKMAANKTFQVSRTPQYQRDKPCSQLASLNDRKAVRERSISNYNRLESNSLTQEDRKPLHTRQLAVTDLETVHPLQKNSPVVLLVPAATFKGSSDPCSSMDSPLEKCENKDLAKILNRTLSPIGTPERFRKLMPHIQSESPPSPAAAKPETDSVSTEKPVVSLTDALALIGSDLSQIYTSPRELSSSCEYSDSLESKGGGSENADLRAIPDSPEPLESNEPRLTFFVSKKSVSSDDQKTVEKVKKTTFTSATVIKSKASVDSNGSSGRKIKKSRRRLLEKTLELSGSSSQSESGPGTPSLPVIAADTGAALSDENHQTSGFASLSSTPRPRTSSPPIAFPISPLCNALSHTSSSVSPLPPAAPSPIMFTIASPPPVDSSSPLHHDLLPSFQQVQAVPATLSVHEESFPVQVAAKCKKRKSEEHVKFEDAGKPDQGKRSKVVTAKPEPPRSVQDRTSRTQRQRATGTALSVDTASLKKTRPAAPSQAKPTNSKAISKGPGAAAVRRTKVVAVAQSKLTFIKPTQTALPRHPMSFAAKNMFYDERWIEKQERGFTWWINYVLTPDDFKVNPEVNKASAVSLAIGSDKFNVPRAPTKEEMSFSTYTARRKLNRLRRSACQLFTSEAMVKAIQRLELEVEARRLLVRKDRHLWKDIGERKKVLNWLLSYNPLWLRIGLETIFGEFISLESNSDTLGLAMFILQRLLWNPDIAADYRHPRVPHLYKDGHEEALSRFTLKKLLLLVCFLDKAKECRLIEHNPCLFCVDAEFKTTKDLLLAFSRDFLSGEGILPRHLGYLGLPVSHVQTPLDEFDFAVKNLAVDLKCGIRLVRVMELLTLDWSLSAKLRLPAISRLQKIHNIDVALQVLKAKGINLKDEHGSIIDSRDIADGHREKTLSLLWKIIFAFHVEVILDESQLSQEIGFLKRTLRTKRRLARVRADQGIQPSPVKTRVPYVHTSTKVTLLMDWVRAVCNFYSLKVENFTVMFSDGRVLCYLIHHYHPSLLPEASINHSTTQTVEGSPTGRLELDCSASDSDSSFNSLKKGGPDSPSVEFKELLENEKSNFRLVNSAVAFLGGVPAMINPADMSNTIPDEKVVMSYLSFLCARLLDLRNETRAARVIQGAWRKYRLKKDLQLYEERNKAALKIQLVVRRFLQKRRAERRTRAAVLIQSAWRGFLARKILRMQKEALLRAVQHEAATIIQAQWRMFSTFKAYHRLRYYTVSVQAQWRMRRAAASYSKVCTAVRVIQKYSRAWALSRKQRDRYLLLRSSVVKLQRAFRRWRARKIEEENHAAAVIQAAFKKWYNHRMAMKYAAAVRIQSWFRMRVCYRDYRQIRRSAVLIQAYCRGQAQRRCFQMLKLQHNAAGVIQRAFRGHVVRKQVLEMRRAAVVIQRRFRASVKRDAQRSAFLRMRCAAVAMQAAFRGKMAREMLKKQHKAATVIQAAFREWAARKQYLALRGAAVRVQRRYRAAVLARKTKAQYHALRKATLVLQASWRGKADRKKIETWHRCATLIQASYRQHRIQTQFTSKKGAALVIQRQYRAFVAGKEMRGIFLQKRAASITLQAGFRGMRARSELRRKHQAATVIQSWIRMFLCKKRYFLMQCAAIIIQSRYRALLLCRASQNEFRKKKQAAVKIQATFRGFRVRREHRRRMAAATAIQAQFRMHKMRMAYLAAKFAAIIIQERYRAQKLRDQELQSYKRIKSAAVVIQAAYRGCMVRRRMAERHQAATVIQRRFLTIQARKQFLKLMSAALTCQQRYRALSLARKVRLDYLSKRRAVVCLQAAWRGYAVRKQLRVQQKAAVIIQSHFRMHQQQTRYRRLCWACKVVQKQCRANKQMRVDMHAMKAMKNAAIVLQSVYRGMKSRRILKQEHQAAAVIQRSFRAHREHRSYLTLKSSVLKIQRRYRANMAAKKQKHQYQQIRKASIVLQAVYRGQQVRKEVKRWHQAATVIQSAFRRYREEVKFQAMRLSAIIIQRRYRALLQGRRDRENFLRMKRSAVVLQAAFRGHRVRSEVTNMHSAALVIQANFRRFRRQKAFRTQRWAAVVLQQRFRAQKQKRQTVKQYQDVRKATVLLQAAFRGMKSRRILKQEHQAAAVIQRSFRAHCEHRSYLTLKSSVLKIQCRYRANMAAKKQKHQYQQIRKASIVLQAVYRGQQVRKEVKRWHQAATVIQSAFRRYREEVKFQAMRLSAIIIQRRYRALLQGRRDRENFLRMKRSAVVLQAAFRGHRVRSEVTNMHSAALVIQANFRRFRQQKAFRRLRWAAVVFQQRFRAQKQKRHAVKQYQDMRKAAVLLQAAFRGMKSRRILKQEHQAAAVIQRSFRAHREHRSYLTLKSFVLKIQRRYRANMAAKKQKHQYQQIRKASIVLQAVYRGQQVRKEVKHWHQAATVIQSACRRYREEVKFQAMRLSAIIIQRRYRALLQGRRDRENFLRKKRSAVVLQAAFRGHRVRSEVTNLHSAALVIQANFRRLKHQKTFRRLRSAAIVLQQRFRAQKQKQHAVKQYQDVRKAAVLLQAAFRGMKSRRILKQEHQAAAVIQRSFRAHREHRSYLTLKSSVLKIQRRYRANMAAKTERNIYLQKRQAAILIQRSFRTWKARQLVVEAARAEKRLRFTAVVFHHLCAIKIQRRLRAHWALESAKKQINSVVTIQRWLRARQQRRRYLEDRRKLVSIQRAVRRWLARRHQAASVIQLAVRKFLYVKRQQRVQQGIVKAQALWRAHCSRRRHDNVKLVKLRHRLRQISAAVREEDKLCNKTSSALDYLLRYKHFSYILEALKNLETATRLSPECCERLVESGATNVIFTLIRCCNRSVPCMDVITFSIQILLNLSKYHKTIEAVYSVENSVETLLDLLQRYREKAGDKVAEKGGSIFTKACFLLALLLQDKRRAEAVMKLPKVLDRIRSIYRLTARKHKMDAERTILKQKMNASINGSFYVPATPRKSRPVPKFAPEWVLRKDKLKDIVDPLRAIHMVADTLSIVL
ncbi:abnormal spindle-like microcephaly-associated protein isoform X2 [Oryzias melastigma]|uniref:abnormal spindle-like microcephaly-associated protein isoform X2 n=1 Tax=Oryzias melastigma TaxID=30732 RepID=UPI000CF7B556|nr:abnormal spindle-like microcephaly-associated protein isoform X2 [Oryzias melastigma]